MVNHDALRVSTFMHAHTEKCIMCGDPNGDTVIIVQIVREPEGKAMELESISISGRILGPTAGVATQWAAIGRPR